MPVLATTALNITSEYAPLECVLVHRPGKEIDRLTPENKSALLFEDIPYLKVMQAEHDAFCRVMRKLHIEVLYLEDLLRDILANQAVRTSVVSEVCLIEGQVGLAAHILQRFSKPAELVDVLFAGITAREFETLTGVKTAPTSLSADFPLLEPIPNAYFTRDPAVVVHGSLISCKAHFQARVRETLLTRKVFEHHERFAGVGVVHGNVPEEDRPFTIEGGDILVLNDQAVAIGSSQRTRSETIASVAAKLFRIGAATRVYEIAIPAERRYMHLDTVFTIVGEGVIVAYPDVINDVTEVILYQPFRVANQIVAYPEKVHASFKNVLEREFGKNIVVVPTGGGNAAYAAREQGADGSNMFAVAPMKVVSYDRNVATNIAMDKKGIEVIPIKSSELVRGLGGPRCMTMPIRRAAASKE